MIDHALPPRVSSWPGLSRPSTSLLLWLAKSVDARHKAGHDGFSHKRHSIRCNSGQTLTPSWDIIAGKHLRHANEDMRR